jgi:lysozyme
MTPSQKCIDLIKQFEGCRLQAYPDPKTGGDPWTVGWGATGPDIKRGVVWTQEQADGRLAADVAAFGKRIGDALNGHPTTQAEYDALVSFAYNIGFAKATGSTLWKMHCAGNFAGAAGQFGLWINKGSPVEKGLTRRRAAESALYRGQS